MHGTGFTSTEKLVVTRAVSMYGIENEACITNYIACMYGYIHPNRWKEIYRIVLMTYKRHGYHSAVDFCEDLRFETARRMYREKVDLRNRILGGEDVEYPDRDECDWNLGDVEETIERLKGHVEEFTEDRQLYSVIDSRIIKQHVEAMNKQSEPKHGVESVPEVMHEAPLIANKDRKRSYYKMTDEERNLDDFIDKVEEEDYNKPIRGSTTPNALNGKYPAMKTVLLGTEKQKASARPRDTTKNMSLEEQYRYIMKKVMDTKKQAKDKGMWRQELRTMTKYYASIIGMAKELEGIDMSIKDNNMTNVILSVLMLLQNVINKTKDEGLVAVCANFKKDLASFNDYYRR